MLEVKEIEGLPTGRLFSLSSPTIYAIITANWVRGGAVRMDLNQAEAIKNAVLNCQFCSGYRGRGLCINHKEIGLNYDFPQNDRINIMFVAESPPKIGNGFFYDVSSTNNAFRRKLFGYLCRANLGNINTVKEFTAKGYYLADAINCRWEKKGENGRSSIPDLIVKNCSFYLSKQLELFKPRYIVAMGNAAKLALDSEHCKAVFDKLKKDYPIEKIIEMTFITTSPHETDEERIAKLKTIAL